MASKYVLNYFDAPGRAEPIRMLFAVAGQEFTDNRIAKSDWMSQKRDTKKYPLSQIPTLEVGDRVICQSQAIARYLAREFGLYGSNNVEASVIDVVCETVNDLLAKFIAILFGGVPESEQGKALVELAQSDGMKRIMAFLDNELKRAGGGFFVGNSITLADIHVFYSMEFMTTRLSGLGVDLAAEYPELIGQLQKGVAENPKIAAYLKARQG